MIYKKDACELIYLLQNKLYPNMFENSGIIPDATIIKRLDYVLTNLDVTNIDSSYFISKLEDVKEKLEKDSNTIILRKERLCNGCISECFEEVSDLSIEDFLDSLSTEQQRKATIHLNLLWAQREGAKINV